MFRTPIFLIPSGEPVLDETAIAALPETSSAIIDGDIQERAALGKCCVTFEKPILISSLLFTPESSASRMTDDVGFNLDVVEDDDSDHDFEAEDDDFDDHSEFLDDDFDDDEEEDEPQATESTDIAELSDIEEDEDDVDTNLEVFDDIQRRDTSSDDAESIFTEAFEDIEQERDLLANLPAPEEDDQGFFSGLSSLFG